MDGDTRAVISVVAMVCVMVFAVLLMMTTCTIMANEARYQFNTECVKTGKSVADCRI